MANHNKRKETADNKKELTVIPSKTKVFVGPETEWKQIIDNSTYSENQVLLLKNDNSLDVKDYIWCEEKSILIVPESKKNTFNIDDYSDNYEIYVSSSIVPYSNKTKDTIDKEEERIRKEEERKEKEINSPKEISIRELYEKKNGSQMYAIAFDQGTNFQKGIAAKHDCDREGHDLRLVIGILYDNKGVKRRVGKVFVCSACGRTYLGASTKKTIDFNEFRNYSFDNWTEQLQNNSNQLSIRLAKGNNKKSEIAVVKKPQQTIIDRIEKIKKEFPLSYPQKAGDTVLIDEKSVIYYGDDLIHKKEKDHGLLTCKIGIMQSGRRRYEFYKNSKYCPVCNRYYLMPVVPFKHLKTKHPYNTFEEGSRYKDDLEKAKIKAQKEREEKLKKVKETSKEVKPDKTQQKQKIATNIKAEDFLVRVSSFLCRKNGHKYEEITACITIILRQNRIQKVFVPGWYCRNCKCYYITENDYQTVDRLGAIVARVYTQKEWYNRGKGQCYYSELNQESILHKLGYNVGASDDLSDSVRQDILASAVDFRLMAKREVIDFLTWMINTRSNNDRLENAVYKWKKDLKFISNYKLNNKEYIEVKSIIIRE